MKIVPISVQWVTGTPFPAHVVEKCGRICYQSDHKIVPCKRPGLTCSACCAGFDGDISSAEAFVEKILKNGHESVLEHVSATLLFTVDRGMTDDAWKATLEMVEATYLNLRVRGVAPQIARSILPNALKADIAVTTNAREWRHICRLRLSPKAHPQMIEAMRLAHGHLLQWFPQAFQEFAKDS
jgi:thymidylate synthase (FAD)